MSLLWPPALVLLLLLPAAVLLDRVIMARRRGALARFGTVASGADPAAGAPPAGRRRRRIRAFVPPMLALAGFAALVVGLARPQVALSAPRLEGTVILAFDVSASMAATDYAPSRMEAAKAAATAFVEQQPSTVQIGIVAFSDSGVSVQPATSDQAEVLAAIQRLSPERGTSLGEGILASLTAIDVAENPNQGFYTNGSPAPSVAPVPAGSHRSAIVVLLSDGENNEAPDPSTAAQAAADRGIRIDTVGIGTEAGTTVTIQGFKVQTALDAATLQSIADTTKGTYFGAPTAAQLDDVYANLDSSLVVTAAQQTEVTAAFAALGLAALAFAALGSLAWLGRAP